MLGPIGPRASRERVKDYSYLLHILFDLMEVFHLGFYVAFFVLKSLGDTLVGFFIRVIICQALIHKRL